MKKTQTKLSSIFLMILYGIIMLFSFGLLLDQISYIVGFDLPSFIGYSFYFYYFILIPVEILDMVLPGELIEIAVLALILILFVINLILFIKSIKTLAFASKKQGSLELKQVKGVKSTAILSLVMSILATLEIAAFMIIDSFDKIAFIILAISIILLVFSILLLVQAKKMKAVLNGMNRPQNPYPPFPQNQPMPPMPPMPPPPPPTYK